MACWVTHLMIADQLLQECELDRHGFCVGNIAPDCNVQNEDWTAFTPPREVTHWMSGARKAASDSEGFYEEYLYKRKDEIHSWEQYSFLLGYYAHLIADAAYEAFIYNEERVRACWNRIDADQLLCARAAGYPKDWYSVKKIFSKRERGAEVYFMEAEYLQEHPTSGYLTEILPLREFPDYIEYLPHASIVRKIKTMGYLPQLDANRKEPVTVSREEFQSYVSNTVRLTIDKFREKRLLEVRAENFI